MKKRIINKNIETKINTKNTPFLIIVESPYKCIKIEKFLGFQYKCIASNGHIREITSIKNDQKNDQKNKYEPIFDIIPEKKIHVENMRKIISCFSPENIFLGTDDDREGEAIAWHICKEFKLDIEKTHRILFHEITQCAIKKAVENPVKIRMDIVFAQHARQVLDRLVGFQISPLLTKRINSSETKYLSAGRCQTPALRLIYDKEISNEKKIIITKYQVNGYFFSQNSNINSFKFPLTFELSKNLDTQQECIHFLELSREFSHELIIEKPQQKRISAPIPFNTSTLLQTANNILHFSPKETMYYCQQLYQAGYITYMRTESTKYSETFLSNVREFILHLSSFKTPTEWAEMSKERRTDCASLMRNGVKELDTIDIHEPTSLHYLGNLSELQNSTLICPHEAIRVTNLDCTMVSIKSSLKDVKQLQDVYDLIRKRTIESCMTDYVYNNIVIKITAPMNSHYTYHLDIPIFIGWKLDISSIQKKNGHDFLINLGEEQTKKNGLLMFLQCAKSPIKCMKIECKMSVTNTNRHYSESELIHDLEKYGIGRPSTFSIIINSIQERNYIVKQNIEGEKINSIEFSMDFSKNKEIIREEKERIIGNEKNKLVLQELGKIVMDELIPTFNDLFSYDYTKKMEVELDKIANDIENPDKKNIWSDICKECDETIKRNTKKWKTEMKSSYNIDNEHELIFTKTGACIRKINISMENKSDEYEYKRVKPNIKIDFEKLRNKEYHLEELLEIPNEFLGEYENHPLYLKNGQYGIYVVWGEKKESIHIEKKIEEITMEDIISFFKTKSNKNKSEKKNVLRVLNERISIRKGKYGAYIHYIIPGKEESPQFYNLKLFPDNYLNVEVNKILNWLENTYGII